MKNTCILFLFFVSVNLFGQSPASHNGYWLPNEGTIRVFVVFAESTSGTVTAQPNWPLNSIPTNADDLFDATYDPNNINGFLTKYFHQASFGKLIVLGDYFNQLVRINATPLTTDVEVIAEIENMTSTDNDITTAHGYSFNNDFDHFTVPSGFNFPKTLSSDGYNDMLMVIWRNHPSIADNSGFANSAIRATPLKGKSGFASSARFESDNLDPYEIIRHEFSHTLYGENELHTADAGTGLRMFLSNPGGWSNMSSAFNYSPSFNAYDRHRMGWKHPQHELDPEIRATCATNSNMVATDLDYGQVINCSSNGEFILRDFVTYGDAIRIKLPHLQSLNSNAYNQYIWIENHQMLPNNIDLKSREDGTFDNSYASVPGIYCYYQVGKDNRNDNEGGSALNGYTYPITAYGNFDMQHNYISRELRFNTNVNNNPLSGYNWLILPAFDINFSNTIRGNETFVANSVKVNNMTLPITDFNRSWLGSNSKPIHGSKYDAFVTGAKMGLGTNPPTSSILTHPAMGGPIYPDDPQSQEITDNRHIYLNGLSIEVLQQYGNGDIRVKIRWNDYDVEDDVRWCGESIVLYEEINLSPNKTILLDHSRTPSRPNNPIAFPSPSSRTFTSPTVFTAKSNSKIHLQNNATIRLINNSSLIIEDGAEVILENAAKIEIKAGSTLELQGNDITLNGNDARIVVEAGATLRTADGVDFTFTGDGYVQFFDGHILEMGNGSRFVLDGQGKTHRFIQLEPNTTLDLTNDLELHHGKVVHKANSKIKVTNAQAHTDDVTFEQTETYGTGMGIEGEDLALGAFVGTDFIGFDEGLKLVSNTSTTPPINVTGGEFTDCNRGINAIALPDLTVKLAHFQYNQTGIRASFVNVLTMEDNTVELSTNEGLWLKHVRYAYLAGDLIQNSVSPTVKVGKGIYAENSNVFLRGDAKVRHNDIGVEMYNTGAYTLTVGDVSCASIYDNNTGIKGENITFSIDALVHACARGDCSKTTPNNFEDNTTYFIDVCYTSYFPLGILARGNYWGTAGPNISYQIKDGTNFCQNTTATVNTSQYVNLWNPNNCYAPFNDDETAMMMNLTDESPEFNCLMTVDNVQRKIHKQYKKGYDEFVDEDYPETETKMLPVSSLNNALTSTATLECEQHVRMAEVFALANSSTTNNLIIGERPKNTATAAWSEGTAVEEAIFEAELGMAIFPNPAKDFVTVTAKEMGNYTVTVYNSIGQVVHTQVFQQTDYINIRKWETGLYMVKVTNEEGIEIVEELMVL